MHVIKKEKKKTAATVTAWSVLKSPLKGMLFKYYHIRADVAVRGILLLHQVDLAAPVLHCVLFGLGF